MLISLVMEKDPFHSYRVPHVPKSVRCEWFKNPEKVHNLFMGHLIPLDKIHTEMERITRGC